MWLVGSVEVTQEDWLGSHGGSWSAGGLFSNCGGSLWVVWDLIPMLGSPDYSTRAWTVPRWHHSYENWQGFSLPGTDSWRCRKPFKGPMHNFSFGATYPGSWQKQEDSGLGMLEEKPGMWLWGSLREQLPRSWCRVISHIAVAIFLKQTTHLWVASAWGEAIALPTGITLHHRLLDCWLWSD